MVRLLNEPGDETALDVDGAHATAIHDEGDSPPASMNNLPARKSAKRKPGKKTSKTPAKKGAKKASAKKRVKAQAPAGKRLYTKLTGEPTPLGKRVRKARLAKGLTQSALAEKAGCSQVCVSRLESGHGQLTDALAAKIAKKVGL